MSEARSYDLSGGSPPAVPAFDVIHGEAKDPEGSFFEPIVSSDEFRVIVDELEHNIDESKIYGTGTVIAPTPSGQLRHMMKLTGARTEHHPDQILADYNYLLKSQQKHPAFKKVPAFLAAENLTEESLNTDYILPYAATLALLRKDGQQDDGVKLGPLAIQRLYSQLSFAVNPKIFKDTYKFLLDKCSDQ